MSKKPSAMLAERIAGVSLLWVVGGVLFFATTGVYPRTTTGWLLFIGFAPVLFLFGEIVGEGAVEALSRAPGIRQVRASVERATAGRRFSWVRIAVALFAALGLVAAAIAAFFVLRGFVGDASRPLGEFLRVHFGAV